MHSTLEAEARGSELFFALVAPVGVRLLTLEDELTRALGDVGYKVVKLKLSKLLERSSTWQPVTEEGEFHRIRHLQDRGNAFRQTLNDPAALALACLAAIREHRARAPGAPFSPCARTAFVISQLKHPAEVALFRKVYGPAFYLVAGYAPKAERKEEVSRRIARSVGESDEKGAHEKEALQLIEDDESQDDDFGQNTRETYPLADVFIDVGKAGATQREVGRFIELIFGEPLHSPSREEYAMYLASAAALRSADESRQVGAAIATKDGDVVAVGANEVPTKGGGQYWPGRSPDTRDQALRYSSGEDRAAELKQTVLSELLSKMAQSGWLRSDLKDKSPNALARELGPAVRRTRLMRIGAFERPVHGEMAALLDAARRGVAVQGLTLYTTTFPCHNCAKHIIAAGIAKVIFIEPYPKSRSEFLHEEELLLEPDPNTNVDGRVVFAAYIGVAPRQYQQLFSMLDRGAKHRHSRKQWNALRTTLPPRHVSLHAPAAYTLAEAEALGALSRDVFKWDREVVLGECSAH